MIKLLETQDYFDVPGEKGCYDYSKVKLFFILYFDSAEDEEKRQKILFQMLQEAKDQRVIRLKGEQAPKTI